MGWHILNGIIVIAAGLAGFFILTNFPNKILIYSGLLLLIIFGVVSIAAGFALKQRKRWAFVFAWILPLIRSIVIGILALIAVIYAKLAYQTVFVGPILDWALIVAALILSIIFIAVWLKGSFSTIKKFR